MKRIASIALISAFVVCGAAPAAELQVGASDTVESVLKAQAGKRLTVRLRSGQEFTGTVRTTNSRVVQLGTLTGREFSDAVVPLEAIDAVIIRTRD